MKIKRKISVRIPVPRPQKTHSTKRGKRGYARSESLRIEREENGKDYPDNDIYETYDD